MDGSVVSKGLVVVTGATYPNSIGRKICEDFREDGYFVIATYNSNDEIARQFEADTGIQTAKFNSGNLEACQNGFRAIEAVHGPIQVLINNAGVISDATLLRMTEEQWNKVEMTNYHSLFATCKAVLPGMCERNQGHIMFMSSINAKDGQAGQTNYASSKAATQAFMKSVAQEMNIGRNKTPGVTFSALSPGYVKTKMMDDVPADKLPAILAKKGQDRLIMPEEISQAALFLVRNQKEWNGRVLAVDDKNWYEAVVEYKLVERPSMIQRDSSLNTLAA